MIQSYGLFKGILEQSFLGKFGKLMTHNIKSILGYSLDKSDLHFEELVAIGILQHLGLTVQYRI